MGQVLNAQDFYPGNPLFSPQAVVSDSRDTNPNNSDDDAPTGTLTAKFFIGILLALVGIRVVYELSE